MRPILLIALVFGAADADVPESKLQAAALRRLPLEERCALTRLLARSFVDVIDLMRLSSSREKPRPELGFVVVVDAADAPRTGLLLDEREKCQPLDLIAPWFSGALRIRLPGDHPLTIAGGYEWVQLVALDGDHLRFARDLNVRALPGCPPADPRGFDVCAGRQVTRAGLPSVIIDVTRTKSGFEERDVAMKFGLRSEAR